MRTLRDGGQTALEIAGEVAAFLAAAERSLDVALYDLRLDGAEERPVSDALLGAQRRGVRVRVLYNVDHPGPIPVPAPPSHVPDALEALLRARRLRAQSLPHGSPCHTVPCAASATPCLATPHPGIFPGHHYQEDSMRKYLRTITMLNASLAAALLALAGGSPATSEASVAQGVRNGHAVYYAPGVFNVVARNRGMAMRQDVDGYAAVIDCGQIGRIIKARLNGRKLETYQVLDCSAPRDRARHQRIGLVIEVDYQSAVRNGFVRLGRAPAQVYYP